MPESEHWTKRPWIVNHHAVIPFQDGRSKAGTGMTVPVDRPYHLAAASSAMFARSDVERAKLGESGCRRVLKPFRFCGRTSQFAPSLDLVTPVTPLSYPQLVQAVISASAVVTDSGGLQKEAFLPGTPTTTIRSETEWVETLHSDWNQLVNDPAGVRSSADRPAPTADRGTPYGDGMAAAATV